MWESISFYLLLAQIQPTIPETTSGKISAGQIISDQAISDHAGSDRSGEIVSKAAAVENIPSEITANGLKKDSVVYRDNIEQYRDRLIAPIVSWVESDLFRFKVHESAPEEQKNIDQSQLTLEKVISSQNFARNVVYDAEFAWLAGEGLLRKATLAFYRRYAASSAEEISYEEVFRFIEPAVVNSYATQTFRFSSASSVASPVASPADEDQISHYSPVVGSVRPIQSANRSDSIIDGEISLDDIFVFSANPHSFVTKIVGQKILLVPFASEQPQPLEKSSTLFSYKNNSLEKFDSSSNNTYASLIGKQSSLERRSLVLWNYEVKAFSSHAAWLPLTVVFEPRQVVIFELTPKDPFYAVGRQYLIVDATTGVPYYKLVYSHGGRFLRTIIGGWHKVSVPKDFADEFKCEANCLVPAFVLAVDRAAKNASVLSVNNIQFYSRKEPDLRFIFNDQQVVLEKEPTRKESLETINE